MDLFYNDGNISHLGHVRVDSLKDSSWVLLRDDVDGEASNDSSDYTVSLLGDGTTVAIVSIYTAVNGINLGHVRVYSLFN